MSGRFGKTRKIFKKCQDFSLHQNFKENFREYNKKHLKKTRPYHNRAINGRFVLDRNQTQHDNVSHLWL